MKFKYSNYYNYNYNDIKHKGFNFRFVNSKTKRLGVIFEFLNGKNLENHYDIDGIFKSEHAGIAHFLEHMLFTNKSENINFLEELVKRKIIFNGATSENNVFYYLNDLFSNVVEEHLELLMKVALTLDADEDSLEQEKGIVSTEISLSSDSPMTLITKSLRKYYKNTTMTHTTAGNVEDIQKITLKDLERFYNYVYNKENLIVYFIGDFSNEEKVTEVINSFDKTYQNIKKNQKITILEKDIYKVNPAYSKDIKFDQKLITINSPKVSEDTWILKYNFNISEFGQKISNEKKYYYYKVLNTLVNIYNPASNNKFKNYLESLDINAYKFSLSTGPRLSPHDINYSIFIAKDENNSNKEEIINKVNQILENLEKFIDEESLQTIKVSSKFSEEIKKDTNQSDLMNNIPIIDLYDLPSFENFGDQEKFYQNIFDKITLEDINHVIKLLNKNVNFVVIEALKSN